MAVDQSMRKLKIPSKFLPYLEKHRIYETFYVSKYEFYTTLVW